MRKLAIALLFVAVALPVVAKVKHKDKRFDPIVMSSAAAAAGRYVGIEDQFVIDLAASGGTIRNLERRGTLSQVVVNGSELSAMVHYTDGTREPLHATFMRRTLNGDVAYGLLMRDLEVKIDESTTLQQLFCRKQ